MSCLVSIVLPVYNGEKYLRESIDSIINQTYTNWELLILDDCSTDTTSEICKQYANNDNRIKYYRNEINLRLPKNLNKGFSLATGEYLTWTSDDNLYLPKAIERMVNVLDCNSDVDFVFASCRIIDGEGKKVEYSLVNPDSVSMLTGKNSVLACFLYRYGVYKEVGDYDPSCILVEDFDYWQRVCAKFNMRGIEEILYYYRWHDSNLTSTMSNAQFCENAEKNDTQE